MHSLVPLRSCDSAKLPHRWLLGGGVTATVRHIRPDDARAFEALILRQSTASRYLRFHSTVNGLTRPALGRLTCDLDPLHFALVLVLDARANDDALIAEARFASADGHSGEIAILVDEAWRCRGICGRMLATLSSNARRLGLSSLHGRVLATNESMLRQVRRAGGTLRRDREDGRVMRFELDLATMDRVNGPESPPEASGREPSRAVPCVR